MYTLPLDLTMAIYLYRSDSVFIDTLHWGNLGETYEILHKDILCAYSYNFQINQKFLKFHWVGVLFFCQWKENLWRPYWHKHSGYHAITTGENSEKIKIWYKLQLEILLICQACQLLSKTYCSSSFCGSNFPVELAVRSGSTRW